MALGVLAGCREAPAAFECIASSECDGAAGGRCEADGLCSYPDLACASGRRYGERSGAVSGACVGGAAGPDGAPVDGTTGGGCALIESFGGELGDWTRVDGTGCSAEPSGGQLEVQNDGVACEEYWQSQYMYKWEAYTFAIEVTDPGPGTNLFFEIASVTDDVSVYVSHYDDKLELGRCGAGDPNCLTDLQAILFQPDEHRYWRLARTGSDQVGLYTTAVDGPSSVLVGSVETPFPTGASVVVRIGTYDQAGVAGTAAFDNLRVCEN